MDNDKQYLDKSGVTSQLKHLVVKLLRSRPAEPLDFIIDQSLHPSFKEKLLAKLRRDDFEVVTFSEFYSAALACCVFLECSRVGSDLFKLFDLDNRGQTDKHLCDTVIQQLVTTLKQQQSDGSFRATEASSLLSADQLFSPLAVELFSSKSRCRVNREEVIDSMLETILSLKT